MAREQISNNNIGRPDRLPGGQHLSKNWPVLHIGEVPDTNLDTWTLRIYGEVENPITLSWQDFLDLPQSDVHADFHCVTTWSTFDNVWTGVRLQDLANLVKPTAEAKFLRMQAEGEYDSNLPMADAMDASCLLCHSWNGTPLTPIHGGPLRTMIPHKYAWKSVKWLRELEFMKVDKLGFWELRGYSNTADPFVEDRFSS